MPFTFIVSNATYSQLQSLIKALEESIRPIQIQTIQLQGSDNSMTVQITAQTYYQPGKIMSIKKETVN
jgi:hypothetical protein